MPRFLTENGIKFPCATPIRDVAASPKSDFLFLSDQALSPT
jgi:hypothetical protein